MILVTQNNEEYEIRFPYDPQIVSMVKEVPGRRWHPEEKFWTIPLARLGFLIAQFKGTKYESQLNVKSDEQLDVNASINEPNQIPDIDISDVHMYVQQGSKVFNHQKDTIKFAKWRFNNGLKSGFILADEPGAGKSLSVTLWAMYMKEKHNAKHCLIIACVNSAKYNWREDIQKHTNGKEIPYILGSRLKRDGSINFSTGSEEKLQDLTSLKMYGGKTDEKLPYFIILNIEAIRMRKGKLYPIANRIIELVNQGEIDLVTLDECHRNMSMSALQGKQILRIKKEVQKQIQWIPMTGTPIVSKPTDVFLPLRLVDGHESNSYWSWCQHYCVYGGFGGHEIIGYKNVPQLKSILQPNMLRRLKKDILDLPPKIHYTEYIENSDYQKKLYDKIQMDMISEREQIVKSLNPLAQFLHLRQVNGSPELVDNSIDVNSKGYLSKNAKLTRLLELLDDILAEPEEKVVVFSNWVEPLRTLYTYISKRYKVCCYTGTMSSDDREKHKQAFINDPQRRVMLGTVGALGTSHTLTVARNVIFYDSPWNPADIEQAEDRCHRPGTTSTVFVYSLITKGTVDEKVHEILSRKEGTANYIVDNELDLHSHPELFDLLLKN